MRKFWHKVLSSTLALAMCLSLLPTAAFAAEPEPSADEQTEQIQSLLEQTSPETPKAEPTEEQDTTVESTDPPITPQETTEGLPEAPTEGSTEVPTPPTAAPKAPDDAPTGEPTESPGISPDADAAEPSPSEAPTAAKKAQIGDTQYDTIQAAIDAAQNDDTITVLTDATFNEATPLTVPADKSITLDLKGHTITQNFTGQHHSALLTNHGTLTITGNGTLTANATAPDGEPFHYGNYTIDNHGTLTIVNGTVKNTTTVVPNSNGAATYAVNSISDQRDVSVTVNGGTLAHQNKGYSIRQMAKGSAHTNDLTVKDGTLTGGIFQQLAPSGSDAAKASLTMNGGELSGFYAINQNSTNGKFENAHITVTGGKIHGAISINWPFSGNTTVSLGHVSITGGTFDRTGFEKLKSIFDIYTNITGGTPKFITGGTFADDPSSYVAEGYEAVENSSNWIVREQTAPQPDEDLNADTQTQDGNMNAQIGGTFKPDGQTGDNTTVTGDNATFDLTSEQDASATTVTATVEADTVKSIGDANASMTLKTDVADVTLDAAAMKTVSNSEKQIKVEINQATMTGSDVRAAVEVKVTADDQNLLPDGETANGTVTISIPVTMSDDETPIVYYVTDLDQAPVYVNKMDSSYADGKVTFSTNHLSKYAVMTKEQPTAEAKWVSNDSTLYGSLTQAFADVNVKKTIILLQNVTVDSNTGYTVPKNQNITLDLNGHTITQTVKENAQSTLIQNNGTLTVIDSKGTGGLIANIGAHADSNWNYGNYVIDNHGVITLNCNISNTLDKPNGAAIALNNASGGKMTIEGGTITAMSTAIRVYAKSNTNSTDLTINGGTITSRDPVWVQADTAAKPAVEVTVTGGEIRSDGKGSNGPTTIRTTHMGTAGLDGIQINVSGGKLTGGNIDLGASWKDTAQTATGEKLNITGGEIDGIKVHTDGSTADHKNEVTGGIFKNPPTTMIEGSSAVAAVTGSNGAVTAVGEPSIKQAAKQDGVTEINITQGNVTLDKNDVPTGAVVKNSGNGTVTVDGTTLSKDQSVTPNPKPDPKPDGGSSHHHSSSSSSSTSRYSISVERTNHGTVTVKPTRAPKGDRVTITVKPDPGYAVDEITVTNPRGKTISTTDKGDGKFTFIMPSDRVTVKVTFYPEQQSLGNPFYDVVPGAYYYDAAIWAAQNGITSGTSATIFSPDTYCTRAQIVTFLWRAAGSPTPYGSQNPFYDVPADSYYASAALWAMENGITTGTSATTFSPNEICTRAQAVTFLYRSSKSPAVNSGSFFGDVAANAYYANAVTWAAQNGITTGTAMNTFSPDANCTRAQIVTFLYRTFGK